MGAIAAASTALGVLKRNPVLFVAAFLVALFGGVAVAIQMALTQSYPILSSYAALPIQLLSLFFVAGGYAMANEGIDGSARLGTIVSAGKEHFLRLLAANVLFFVVAFATFFVVAIAAAIVGAVALVGGASFGANSALGGLGVLGLILAVLGVYLLSFAVVLFFQFFGPAVVVSNADPVEALKRSYRLVRQNILSTIGFDIIQFAVIAVTMLPLILLGALQFDSVDAGSNANWLYAGLDTTTAALFLVSIVALSTFSGAFVWAFQVAFYKSLGEQSSAVERDVSL